MELLEYQADFYRSALALIVPSVCYETFGIILIESFREGTPVIARRLGPLEEIVESCGGGLLFEDAAGLRSAMGRLQGEAGCRESMGRAARAGFEDRWSESAVMARYGEVLAAAADEAGNGRLATAIQAGI